MQDFVWEVRPGVPYVYSDLAYALGWAIAGGPIVVGFIDGIINAVGASGGVSGQDGRSWLLNVSKKREWAT